MKQARIGIELRDGVKLEGCCLQMINCRSSESGEQLQRLIHVVHSYCCKQDCISEGCCRLQLKVGGTGSA